MAKHLPLCSYPARSSCLCPKLSVPGLLLLLQGVPRFCGAVAGLIASGTWGCGLKGPVNFLWKSPMQCFGRWQLNSGMQESPLDWTLRSSDANPAKPFAVCQCVSGMLQRPCVWMPVSLTCLLATAVCHPDPLSEVGWSALGPGKLSLAHLGFLQGFDKEHFPLSAKGPSFSIIMPVSAFGQDNENMISNLKKIDGVILNKWLLNVLHNLQLNTFSFSNGCVCVCWCWCYFMWCDERKIDFLESIVYVI